MILNFDFLICLTVIFIKFNKKRIIVHSVQLPVLVPTILLFYDCYDYYESSMVIPTYLLKKSNPFLYKNWTKHQGPTTYLWYHAVRFKFCVCVCYSFSSGFVLGTRNVVEWISFPMSDRRNDNAHYSKSNGLWLLQGIHFNLLEYRQTSLVHVRWCEGRKGKKGYHSVVCNNNNKIKIYIYGY